MSEGITDQNFTEVLAASEKPVLVCFMSTFCGPSHGLFAVLDDTIEQSDGAFVYHEVDVEKVPVMTRTFEVKGTPQIIWFHRGEPIGSRVGTMTTAFLRTFLADMLARSK